MSARKLRAACDVCHKAKLRCSGGLPCSGCANSGHDCYYSYSNRLGRPKGAKNKTTRRKSVEAPGEDIYAARRSSCANPENIAYSEPADGDSALSALSDPFTSWDWTFGLSPIEVNETSLGFPTHQGFPTQSYPAQDPGPVGHSSFPEVSPLNDWNYNASLMPNEHIIHQQDARPPEIPEVTLPPRERHDRQCTCVQLHAQFFNHIKTMDQNQAPPSLSATVEAANHISDLCQPLLSCSSCKEDDDDAARLLLVLSIRTIVKRFQVSLCTLQRTASESEGEHLQQGHNREQTCYTGQTAKVNTVKVGHIELSGDDQTYVIKMLGLRTLGKIRDALRSLKETGKHATGSAENNRGAIDTNAWAMGENWRLPGDTNHDGQVLRLVVESLCGTLREIERSLENLAGSGGSRKMPIL